MDDAALSWDENTLSWDKDTLSLEVKKKEEFVAKSTTCRVVDNILNQLSFLSKKKKCVTKVVSY